jgi:hypothetical protein
MSDQADIEKAKQRVSGKLLAIDGVSGVGVGSGRIHVYLTADRPEVRGAVDRILQAEAPDIPHAYVVTGEFRAG